MSWRRFVRRRQWDRERAAEIADYIDRETSDNVARGMSPDDARSAARRKFGNPTLIREEIYRMNTAAWLESLSQDLRYAFRVLRKTPGFTAIAILSLALGVGANTAVFSVVHGVLLRALPYPEAARLVAVKDAVTIPEFEFWKENASSFSSVAGHRGVTERRLDLPGRQEWIGAMLVTRDFFGTLGAPLALGRDFDPAETTPTGPQAIILTDSLWRRAFQSDAAAVGRVVTLDDQRFTVVGVTPPGFWTPQSADAFVPLRPTGNLGDSGTNTTMIARLKSGVSLDRANAEMPALMENFRRSGRASDTARGRTISLTSYRQFLTGANVRTNLLVLLGAAALLLLIACANLGSLLLARIAARQTEIAVRLALGSGPGRLLRQFLIESLLVALAGSAAGVLGAYWSLGALLSIVPFPLVSAAPIRLDWPVLAFATGIAFAACAAFSLPAFFTAFRMDLQETLKAAGRGNTTRQRARSALVIGEVALSVTLLVSAALLIQSLYRLHREQLGFDPKGLLTFWAPLPQGAAFKDPATRAAYLARLHDRLRAIPGARSVAAASVIPLTGQSNFPVQEEGKPANSIGGMEIRIVSPEYFDTMGIRVVRGRAITAADGAAAPQVALVNETVARRWWPKGDDLGKRVLLGYLNGKSYPLGLDDPAHTVAGIVADTKTVTIKEKPRTTLYLPLAQAGWYSSGMNWIVRGNVTAQQLRAAAAEVDPRQRIERVRAMESILAGGTANSRFDAWLFGGFAALALLLTAIGVYGLLAFSVARRTNEIGTRMALGASRFEVLRMVLRQGLGLVCIGLALGLAGAFAVTRSLTTLLFNVTPTDPVSFAAVAAVLIGAGLLASYIPARRATKVDPLIALRYE